MSDHLPTLVDAAPCPFCGSTILWEGQIELQMNSSQPPKTIYYVSCHDCYAQGPRHKTLIEAIAVWDERPAE